MKRKLESYEKYKESKILWINEIPSHWEVLRGKSLFKSKKQLNKFGENNNVLSLTLRGVVNNSIENPEGLVPKDYNTYQIFDKGDLVFKLIDLENFKTSRVGLVHEKGIMSPAYIRLCKQEDINERYFYYQYYDLYLRGIYNKLGAGVRSTLSATDLLNLPLVVPPIDEQKKIIKYLDYQFANIKEFITKKKKLIEALKEQKQVIINEVSIKGINSNVKMKPSDIEWVGDIPEHWKVSQVKRIFRENNRPYRGEKETQLSLSQKDGLIPSVNMKERSLQTSTFENWKITIPGDLVLNRFKAHLGVFFCSKLRGIVTFHYGVFEPIVELETKYYEHLFHSSAYKCIFAGRSNGMTVGLQNLSNQNFYNVFTIIPPINEQKEISEYIEQQHMEINKAILKIQKEIDLITEYQTSLISNVVTGQVCVTNIDIDELFRNGIEPMDIIEEELEYNDDVLEIEECEV